MPYLIITYGRGAANRLSSHFLHSEDKMAGWAVVAWKVFGEHCRMVVLGGW